MINELNSTISLFSYKKDSSQYTRSQTITTLPQDFNGENYCADIHIDHTGAFLYASNRGHQSIAIYAIDRETGKLTSLGWQEVSGNWPRNFSITPDNNFLVVANERSDNIVSFKRDTVNGTLSFSDQISVPSPVCIEF